MISERHHSIPDSWDVSELRYSAAVESGWLWGKPDGTGGTGVLWAFHMCIINKAHTRDQSKVMAALARFMLRAGP